MARQINVVLEGNESVFDFSKVDRFKLYGKRQRIVLDDDGHRCEKAELSDDGAAIIRSGMSMQAHFDESGEWVEHGRMVGLDEAGNAVDKVPSTLGVGQELALATPEELSQNEMVSVYHLSEVDCDAALLELLAKGNIYRFPFNYRADYCAETAFLLSNKEGVFVLVTKDASPQWCQLETVAVEDFSQESDADDELDFEMF